MYVQRTVLYLPRYIRGEPEKTSCVVRDVGNVTKDSEVTFEYGIRRVEKKDKVKKGMNGVFHLVFGKPLLC